MNDPKLSIAHLANSDDTDEDKSNDEETKEEVDDDGESFSKRLQRAAFKHIDLPPPLELIAGRAFKEDEPIKTGAPIAFVSLA